MKPKNRNNNKVLFISRDFSSDKRQVESSGYIIKSLKKKYGVKSYINLDEGVIELVRSNLSSDKFNAIVTHVPYGRLPSPSNNLRYFRETVETESAYGQSLNILRQIKMIDDIPIIAYTGAGGSSAIYAVFMEEGGVDCIVHKTLDSKDDLRNIKSALEKLLRKYRQMPLNIPKPVLKDREWLYRYRSKSQFKRRNGFLKRYCDI